MRKTRNYSLPILIGTMVCCLGVACKSWVPSIKSIPLISSESIDSKFINTRTIKSRIGNLKFKRGFPSPETTEKLFDFRTFSRGVEVFNQNVFGASMYRMRQAYAEVGAGKANKVLVWKNRMDSKSIFLTANSETVYAFTFLDLKNDGPTVVEAPPNVLGILDDMWCRYIGDIGALGPDKGEGGKYLVLPPGYDGNVPDGYYVMQSRTYGVWTVLRAGLEYGKPDAANERYEQYLKIYPLSKAANPEATVLINASGMEMDTIHAENYEMFEELGRLVQEEHPDALSSEQKFFLAQIGMKSGKAFSPDAKTTAILVEAADVGAAMLRTNMWEYTGDKWIYPDRKWWNPFVGGVHTFDSDGYIDFDAQAFFAVYATGVTPAMASKFVGMGSQYLCTHLDRSGTPLNGGKTYKLNVPRDVPAKDFWSVVVYDSASRSMIQTSQYMPSISTYTNPEVNADGSINIYFGPKAPAGKEKNWIETIPGKGWTTIFRLYGPLEDFYNQSWKLNDIEEFDPADESRRSGNPGHANEPPPVTSAPED